MVASPSFFKGEKELAALQRIAWESGLILRELVVERANEEFWCSIFSPPQEGNDQEVSLIEMDFGPVVIRVRRTAL